MFRLFLLCCFLMLICLSACQPDATEPPGAPEPEESPIPFRTDGTLDFLREGEPVLSIDIEIADTDSAMERGMMQRTGFPPMSGMLFIFDRERPQSFWMANTPVALDLIFIDTDSNLVSIAKYAKPFSAESITSEGPAQYVLEVPAGFSDTYGLTTNERVRWRRTD